MYLQLRVEQEEFREARPEVYELTVPPLEQAKPWGSSLLRPPTVATTVASSLQPLPTYYPSEANQGWGDTALYPPSMPTDAHLQSALYPPSMPVDAGQQAGTPAQNGGEAGTLEQQQWWLQQQQQQQQLWGQEHGYTNGGLEDQQQPLQPVYHAAAGGAIPYNQWPAQQQALAAPHTAAVRPAAA